MLAATLGNAQHSSFVSAGMLARHEPKPGGQMPAIPELLTIADSGNNRRCRLRSNALDPDDPLAGWALLENLSDLLVKRSNPTIQVAKQVPEFFDSIARHGALVDMNDSVRHFLQLDRSEEKCLILLTKIERSGEN